MKISDQNWSKKVETEPCFHISVRNYENFNFFRSYQGQKLAQKGPICWSPRVRKVKTIEKAWELVKKSQMVSEYARHLG